MHKFYMLFLSMVFSFGLCAQELEHMGKAVDHLGQPLSGVRIVLKGNTNVAITDANGNFFLRSVKDSVAELTASLPGYQTVKQKLTLSSKILTITLKPVVTQLKEVTILDNLDEQRIQEESMNIEIVRRDFLLKNLGGSLMKSLDRLPGIKTIGIGSGQSKPLIRGLGFNRVVVVDKGLKHEGQQWGADHGLELDQFATREVEVIKGAASFVYGSDAIAGIIALKPPLIPAINSIGGSVDLTAKSNNRLYGTSVNINGRTNNWFFDSRLTYQNYADYNVPADAVYVYDYKVPLNNGYLRNTAGSEADLHLSIGYVKEHFRSILYVSNVRNRTGFFANAHGLEPRRVDEDFHDSSLRDIQMSSQEVNHLKLINRTDFQYDNHTFKLDLGFQRNFRQEYSQYVNHGYMPALYPENRMKSINLERQFQKNVYSANLKDEILFRRHKLSVGINTEVQHNDIAGWSFLVPAFQQLTAGAFLYDQYQLSDHLRLHTAIRYDHGNIKTEQYDDWFESPVANTSAYQNLTRASKLNRSFNSLVYSLGMNASHGALTLKWNVGKSFRMPIAKELAANGVNYHYFSYEKGNSGLSPEVSYQADIGLKFATKKWSINFSPFYNYFPNYIYLNPTANHDFDYGAGNQVFEYAQSRVRRYGAELQFKATLLKGLSTEILGEYLNSIQLSGDKQGYTLPFSPPQSLLLNLTYSSNLAKLRDAYFSLDYRITGAQNNIVPPERKTEGYQIFNLQAGAKVNLGGRLLGFNFQAQNLFNTRYLNHTSFYRLISLPEAGRNLILSLNIPLNKNNK
jgi:iron complex outermembrane receptor protein